MTTSRIKASVSRRSALAGLGAGGLGVALAATAQSVAAQDATADATANHPLVGVWNSTNPDISLATFHPDGSMSIGIFSNFMNSDHEVVIQSQAVGTWEPAGPRSAHFTSISLLTDARASRSVQAGCMLAAWRRG